MWLATIDDPYAVLLNWFSLYFCFLVIPESCYPEYDRFSSLVCLISAGDVIQLHH